MPSSPRTWSSLALVVLTACGVGGVKGGDDDDDDGQIDPADAAPDPIQCATKFAATGELDHEIAPVEGGSCDGAGSWTVTLATPTADEDGHDQCTAAPAEQTFNVTVVATDRDENNLPIGYSVTDDDDGARTWEINVDDKSGSCSGSFQTQAPDGTTWSWHATEDGADGPLAGQGFYEERDDV